MFLFLTAGYVGLVVAEHEAADRRIEGNPPVVSAKFGESTHSARQAFSGRIDGSRTCMNADNLLAIQRTYGNRAAAAWIGRQPVAQRDPTVEGTNTPGTDPAHRVRVWLEQHQFAPPAEQPAGGERHVLLNGEDMPLSRAVQLGAGTLHQPAAVVRTVIVGGLSRLGPTSSAGARFVGPGSLLPSPTGFIGFSNIDPAICRAADLHTIDEWLEDHQFAPPAIRDPVGDRVMLDGRENTIEQVADQALAILGGLGYLNRADILVHLRQRYVAARGGASNQIAFGYTLTPRFAQAATGPTDPHNPIRTQHQFSFTITRANHASDSSGLESSFQGGVAFNDAGDIVSLQAGGQEAIVLPLLRGWIQISGFVQTMMGANWSQSASGRATATPAVQVGGGAQVLVTPNAGGPLEFLNGHIQVGIQVTGGVQLSLDGGGAVAAQGNASAGLVVNFPF